MRKKTLIELQGFLDESVLKYNTRSFIEHDPVSVPHLFTKKEDIEVSGLLVSTISWGNRKSILKNANDLMLRMDMEPFQFVINSSPKELKSLQNFVHRTFNGQDLDFFIRSLKHIYKKEGGLENSFYKNSKEDTLKERIVNFRTLFLKTEHEKRSEKHISNPAAKSSAKRLCMFLRWMVRNDKAGVDFGIWKSITPSELFLPLDVHTGNIGRKLGLLKRTQNDWQAVEEITAVLRSFDASDPVKYDFALFGLGVDKQL